MVLAKFFQKYYNYIKYADFGGQKMKKVLISGGSRGIGRACVEHFAKMGYSVAFIYKSQDEAAKSCEECGAIGIKADISDPASAKEAVRRAIETLGGLDVLINNAGIAQIKLFTDISDEDWNKMISVNLSGAFYLTREALAPMIAQKSGRIINIGSMWGKCGASCEVHYSASKAALRGMTMALAKEVGPSGITVNCIEPGVIDTDMCAGLSKEDIDALCDATPLSRIGVPQDVAYLAEFLASDGAAFITGQCIGVDGGFAI
jgi:3-oxoacyl-[acyl-carrier protein] reductase